MSMATEDKAKANNSTAKGLQQDRLVEKLVPDPAAHEPAVQLTGWLGKSTRGGVWRLYLTPQLDEYVQFPETAVVHSEQLDVSQSAAGGTMVWLKAGTSLDHTQVVSKTVQADFLSGDITDSYMAGSAPSFATARAKQVIPTTTRGYQCSVNPHIPACQVRTEACGYGTAGIACGTGPFCGSGQFVCGYSAGCSVGRECSVGCL
jgi:hypothetical protein